MTKKERDGLAKSIEDQIRPLLDRGKYDDGYDCCGCSTYDFILDHAVAIVRGETYVHPFSELGR